MATQVVLLKSWPRMFGMRLRTALAEKGIEFEYKEEDLRNKSPLLLKMNPVHKNIPVLIHDNKPVCESLIALQYIDEVWHETSPLLPSDPNQKSQALFWADYVDKKIHETSKKVWTSKTAKDVEAEKKELIDYLKVMEGVLGDKPYFGGETFGYVDVSLVPFCSWFYTWESCGKFSVEAECHKLVAWAKRCMKKESVAKSLPDPHKVYDYVLTLRKAHGID